MKRNDRLWGVSLILMGICAFIISGSRLLGIVLPDAAVRLLGAASLVGLLVFGYASAKKFLRRDNS